MVSNFLTHGFRSIVLLNGHGGNVVPSQQAMFELRQERRARDDIRLLSATYWLAGEVPTHPSFRQPQVYHAGEWETSMILHLHPHLVGEFRDLPPVPRMEPCAPAHSAWITKERSAPGYIGDPAAATAEKGALLLDHFAANVVALLERVIDDARETRA
jgi:creatinine amidohydrolase